MLTSTPILYIISVLAWGTGWFAIKLQLGVVDPVLSVGYRFALAAALLMAWCFIRRKDMRFGPRDHVWMGLQGVLLFSTSHLLAYLASAYLTSGLVAVVFSTIVIWNILMGRLFFATPITPQMLAGAATGVSGLALVFWPEVEHFTWADHAMHSLALCLIATVLLSLGNMVSARNQSRGLPVMQVNAYAMAYGAALTFFSAFWIGLPFRFDVSVAYISSLLYLAAIGSAAAFGAYLTLLGRIGPSRAAYATVMFPIVALVISVALEDFTFTPTALAGVGTVVLGNVLVLAKPKHFVWLKNKA